MVLVIFIKSQCTGILTIKKNTMIVIILNANNSNDLNYYSNYENLQANYIKLGTLPNEGHLLDIIQNVRWFEGYGVDWYALNGTLSAALNINYTFTGTLTEVPYALSPPPPILSNGYVADFLR
jgi:hypothetical protein